MEFLGAASALVDAPLPTGTLDADAEGEEEGEEGGAEGGGGGWDELRGSTMHDDRDGPAVMRARVAAVLRRQRAYVELALRMEPMVHCFERCLKALRGRR